MSSMKKTYGSDKKAEQVFYASRNAGKITGVDPESQPVKHAKRHKLLRDSY